MLIRSQVIFQPVSALPEDQVINTWHFEDAGDTDFATAADAINGVLAEMYTRDGTNGESAFDRFLSPSISRVNLPILKSVEIDEETGLAISDPREDRILALHAPTNAQAAPREVSLCLSMHADLTNYAEEIADTGDAGPERDRPASRRRGRVYLGPFNSVVLGAGAESRPTLGLLETVVDMGRYLLSDPAPLQFNELRPVVYSRKMRATAAITGFWVDNEWDIQRRRGLGRTTRLTVGTGL